MPDAPDTRHSLILRLSEGRDEEAWCEFVEIYQPLVFRLARRKGLQDADAAEVTQEILLAVAQAVDRWKPTGKERSFRAWLYRIARNIMINFVTRGSKDAIGRGDTQFQRWMEELPSPDGPRSAEFDLEYRRRLFNWAAERIRPSCQETTWRAFWITAVEGRSVEEAAATLQTATGAIYVARSRVMAKLRREIERIERQQES